MPVPRQSSGQGQCGQTGSGEGRGRQRIVDGLALILFHGKGSHWMVRKVPSYLTDHLPFGFYFLGLAHTSVLDFLYKSL